MTRPTLLFIHGFPLDHTIWQPQVSAFAPAHPVLAPDLRGFGEDERLVPDTMTMDMYATDLKELLDAQGVDSVIPVGLSMGGYIAMAFAALWPERVHALALVNTRAGADDADGVKARLEMARSAEERGMALIARGMVPRLLADRTLQERPELGREMERTIARQSPAATAAAARGMAQRPDRTPWLRTFPKPVLVITGDQDKIMPLPTSQAMAEAAPHGRLVVLPHAGHLSNLENPAAFNAELRALMAG